MQGSCPVAILWRVGCGFVKLQGNLEQKTFHISESKNRGKSKLRWKSKRMEFIVSKEWGDLHRKKHGVNKRLTHKPNYTGQFKLFLKRTSIAVADILNVIIFHNRQQKKIQYITLALWKYRIWVLYKLQGESRVTAVPVCVVTNCWSLYNTILSWCICNIYWYALIFHCWINYSSFHDI